MASTEVLPNHGDCGNDKVKKSSSSDSSNDIKDDIHGSGSVVLESDGGIIKQR